MPALITFSLHAAKDLIASTYPPRRLKSHGVETDQGYTAFQQEKGYRHPRNKTDPSPQPFPVHQLLPLIARRT